MYEMRHHNKGRSRQCRLRNFWNLYGQISFLYIIILSSTICLFLTPQHRYSVVKTIVNSGWHTWLFPLILHKAPYTWLTHPVRQCNNYRIRINNICCKRNTCCLLPFYYYYFFFTDVEGRKFGMHAREMRVYDKVPFKEERIWVLTLKTWIKWSS